MIQPFSSNPFRILGVFSNSPIKDIVANKAKMDAFTKVGKEVSFPLDLTKLLGKLDRTTESIVAADSQLTIEEDRMRAAQLWFVKTSSGDEDAVARLAAGDVDSAMEIWIHYGGPLVQQNIAMCHLLEGDFFTACHTISRFYREHREEFLAAIGINHDITYEKLAEGFATAMLAPGSGIEYTQLLKAPCGDEWKYAVMTVVANPIVKKIDDAVAISKLSEGKEPSERLKAGRILADVAIPLLDELGKILDKNDQRLVNASNNVAMEVLQCGIDYYNHSMSPYAALESLDLQSTAAMITCGIDIKEKYRKTAEVYEEMVSRLKQIPKGLEEEFDAVNKAVEEYIAQENNVKNALELIERTKRILRKIEKSVGWRSPDVKDISSYVVATVVGRVMTELNTVYLAFYNDDLDKKEKKAMAKKYDAALEDALKVFDNLRMFAMNEYTEELFSSNVQAVENNRTVFLHGKHGNFWVKLHTVLKVILYIYAFLWVIGFIVRCVD